MALAVAAEMYGEVVSVVGVETRTGYVGVRQHMIVAWMRADGGSSVMVVLHSCANDCWHSVEQGKVGNE